MKISKLKQIIQEEILNALNENRYKEGDKLNYRGINYTVLSDSGYVVNVVDEKGNKAMFNYNQLNQGVFKKPVYEEGKQTYEFIVKYWENRGEDKNFYTTGPIKATSEEEAYKIAKAKADEFAEEEFVKIDSIKLKK